MSDLPARVGEVDLRPATPADRALLLRIFSSTREEEMAATGWPARRRRDFLESQFRAQQRHFSQAYPKARLLVLERGGEPVGRLYWHWLADELRLIDIAILPAWRGQGLGTQLVTALRQLAWDHGRPIGLHVEAANPAQRLYQRLGFSLTGQTGGHLRMQCAPRAGNP